MPNTSYRTYPELLKSSMYECFGATTTASSTTTTTVRMVYEEFRFLE